MNTGTEITKISERVNEDYLAEANMMVSNGADRVSMRAQRDKPPPPSMHATCEQLRADPECTRR